MFTLPFEPFRRVPTATCINCPLTPPSPAEGAQLLCLIEKQQDACRYLQTYGEWYYSVWLAKSTLQEKDCVDVFCKWAEHLAAVGVNQKVSADAFWPHLHVTLLPVEFTLGPPLLLPNTNLSSFQNKSLSVLLSVGHFYKILELLYRYKTTPLSSCCHAY